MLIFSSAILVSIILVFIKNFIPIRVFAKYLKDINDLKITLVSSSCDLEKQKVFIAIGIKIIKISALTLLICVVTLGLLFIPVRGLELSEEQQLFYFLQTTIWVGFFFAVSKKYQMAIKKIEG